jgi:hypothetical protein
VLFDVYLTWVRVERYLSTYDLPPPPENVGNESSFWGLFGSEDPIKLRFGGSPLIFVYIFFVVLCAAETAGLHLSIRWGAYYLLGYTQSPPPPPEPSGKLT